MLPLLALSLLPLSALAHSSHSHANGRKTVNFHPHPHRSHRSFHTTALPALGSPPGFGPPSTAAGGRQAFVDLAQGVLGGVDGTDWFVRDDSYTDARTRVTHVFVRQLADGLEIVDGDANLNFGRDGALLSVGNSFFKGSLPTLADVAGAGSLVTSVADVDASVYAPHCASLLDRVRATSARFRAMLAELDADAAAAHLLAFGHDQTTFSTAADAAADADVVVDEAEADELDKVSQAVKELGRLFTAMCPSPDAASSVASALSTAAEGLSAGAGPALLSFLAVVHPDPTVASALAADPKPFLAELASSFESHLIGGRETQTEVVRGAPGITGADGAKAKLGWVQTDDGLKLVWNVECEMLDNWYEGTVDVETNRVLSAIDWARDAPAPPKKEPAHGGELKTSYNVWPLGVNDPSVGNRSVLHSPHDVLASPAGWHAIPLSTSPFLSTTPGVTVDPKAGWVNTTTTLGNNVFAQENWEGQSNWVANYRPVASNGSFDYPYGEEEGLRPKEYADLAITELFYTCNSFHDLTHRLGFDEPAGNFQEANFGRGGKGGDAVIANAQDGSGTNNANFATPPDGQHGRMRMYVWDTATPYRDGDLEAGIVIHEYAHGVSTRLTGGPANSGCLGWGEAGGMGEGWGDFFATQIRKTAVGKKDADFPMGAWAANRAGGIRNYPYSTNATVNPSTYKTLDKGGYFGVHAIGEVWAQFLHVLTERLIATHGFSDTLFPPTNVTAPNDYYVNTAEYDGQGLLEKPLVPKHGNTLAVQLVINGMKLQPCRPSFFDARDAIVQADALLTGGSNACDIWAAFADHGLGPDAALRGATPWGGGVRVEDYSVPKGVCKGKKGE